MSLLENSFRSLFLGKSIYNYHSSLYTVYSSSNTKLTSIQQFDERSRNAQQKWAMINQELQQRKREAVEKWREIVKQIGWTIVYSVNSLTV